MTTLNVFLFFHFLSILPYILEVQQNVFFCVYKSIQCNDMEFKSQEMITGLERPDISPAMGAEKYSLLWWRPFPGFKYQVQVSRTLSQVLGLEDLGPKPKAKLIGNLAGDDIRGERWWVVRLPSAGINNSSLRISVINLTFKSVSHQLVTILLLTEILVRFQQFLKCYL